VKVTEEVATKTADEKVTASGTTTTEKVAEPEAPKQDFSIGLEQTDAEKEAARRAARAKRFGIPENEESKKLAERAKKFGLGGEKNPIIKDLDSALPERRPKRAREEKQSGGRAAKKQTPDRRTEPKPKAAVAANPSKKATGKVTDDPTEKAKAEARAKRFGKTAT
jgi:SAP domain-containing ribonucleoprotein